MKLNVVIITMGLSKIVKPIVNNHDVVGIVECAPRKKTLNKKTSIFFYIAKKIYNLFKTNKNTLSEYSKEKDIPYYYMDNGSDINLENWIREKKVDVIVVHAMSQLLKENIFNIPKYKTINLHLSYLPKYRGPNSFFWMYYDNVERGGVSLHYIDKGEDTGNIIYQEEYKLKRGMKFNELHDLCVGEIGVNLILKALKNINSLPNIVQPKKSPTIRARNLSTEEHKKIINWDEWEIDRIWHILSGNESWFNPIEQPKGLLHLGQRWIIKDYTKCDMKGYITSNIYNENGVYFIACNDGKIRLDVKVNIKTSIFYFIRKVLSNDN